MGYGENMKREKIFWGCAALISAAVGWVLGILAWSFVRFQ